MRAAHTSRYSWICSAVQFPRQIRDEYHPVCEAQVHVDRAIAFANALRAHGYIQLGKRSASTGASSLAPFAPRNGPKLRVRAVRVTPFYDDVWPERGRCQGMRPCKEPVDQAYIHRATAMMCPAYAATGGWQARLREAKSWIPEGHPSASLLYLYDGQTTDLLRETFETYALSCKAHRPLTMGLRSQQSPLAPWSTRPHLGLSHRHGGILFLFR